MLDKPIQSMLILLRSFMTVPKTVGAEHDALRKRTQYRLPRKKSEAIKN